MARKFYKRKKKTNGGRLTVAKVKRIIRGEAEVKVSDGTAQGNQGGNSSIFINANWLYISGVSQGDNVVSNRIGDEITIIGIGYRINYATTGATALQSGLAVQPLLRVCIVVDKENQQATPTTKLFATEGTVDAPMGFMSLPTANKRFRILSDRTHAVAPVFATGAPVAQTSIGCTQETAYHHWVDLDLRKRPIKQHFVTTGNTITGAETNAIFIYMISNCATASTGIVWDLSTRIVYKDL